jgi:tRNA threonylcarbamoyladenosine biosynthesis protein TsaB
MNYLLHIDTSGDKSSFAIGCDGAMVAHRTHEAAREHAATINTITAELLADAGITFAQLTGIVVCAGPGSYTGLRIGMATAKGLCYALNIPLLLDNKLTLLACQQQAKYKNNYELYIALLTAREKEFFICAYDNALHCLIEPQHIMEEQLEQLIGKKESALIVGAMDENAVKPLMIKNLQIENNVEIDVPMWVARANEQYNCKNYVNLSAAEPFYLKQVYTHK